jgi:hypothetical protein
MRVLILNTDYGVFLRDLYGAAPGLADAPYAKQLAVRNDSLFGVADFYSLAFNGQGHDAWEVHANNAALQAAWLRANNLNVADFRPPSGPAPRTPGLIDRAIGKARRIAGMATPPAQPEPQGSPPRPFTPLRAVLEPNDLDLLDVLVAQARAYKPDVILNQSVSEILPWQLEALRPHTKYIVGQIASPLPDNVDYKAYDLMISSLPNFVETFRAAGVRAELNRLGFGVRVLESLAPVERDIEVSFMGSITPDHAGRFAMLEDLARRTDIAIWGRMDSVPEDSPLWARYRGPAWGRDMYNVLARSKITINQHIDIAEGHANNMRLYEATGVGALLLTDWKEDIGDIFTPGREIATYSSADECIDLINYYRTHETERAAIAAAGQQRTLSEHSFDKRVAELLAILPKFD